MRIAIVVFGLALGLGVPRLAGADPVASLTAATRSTQPARRHSVYLEVLGKAGPGGVGYAYQLTPRFEIGAVGSLALIDGQRLMSLTPYFAVRIVRRGHHAWFADAGPQIAHLSTPSPVPEWPGTSSTGVGAVASSGYEYRNHLVVRAFAMAAIGRNGIAPWVGLDLGWTL